MVLPKEWFKKSEKKKGKWNGNKKCENNAIWKKSTKNGNKKAITNYLHTHHATQHGPANLIMIKMIIINITIAMMIIMIITMIIIMITNAMIIIMIIIMVIIMIITMMITCVNPNSKFNMVPWPVSDVKSLKIICYDLKHLHDEVCRMTSNYFDICWNQIQMQ